jgi:hypothetical protein
MEKKSSSQTTSQWYSDESASVATDEPLDRQIHSMSCLLHEMLEANRLPEGRWQSGRKASMQHITFAGFSPSNFLQTYNKPFPCIQRGLNHAPLATSSARMHPSEKPA